MNLILKLQTSFFHRNKHLFSCLERCTTFPWRHYIRWSLNNKQEKSYQHFHFGHFKSWLSETTTNKDITFSNRLISVDGFALRLDVFQTQKTFCYQLSLESFLNEEWISERVLCAVMQHVRSSGEHEREKQFFLSSVNMVPSWEELHSCCIWRHPSKFGNGRNWDQNQGWT